MPLTVEDGTGLALADSYASRSDADAYHAARGNAAWAAASSDARDAALRKATQYLDTRYRWVGNRSTLTQALEWPRYFVPKLGYPSGWPQVRVIHACIELALRALDSDLLADDEGRDVVSESVGPISVEYQPKGGGVRYPAADLLVSPLVLGGRSSVRLDLA